jgi:hypothetical protein
MPHETIESHYGYQWRRDVLIASMGNLLDEKMKAEKTTALPFRE